jgi:rhodanese-related sulfurtransferase
MMMKRAIAQAAVLVIIGVTVSLIFNTFSANGIDLFRKPVDAPVYDNGGEDPIGTDPAARDGIYHISLEELREMIDAGYPVLDARTSDEYEAGHIPGAILCDYFEMGRYFETVLPRLNREERIGLYCSGPSCDDSEMLAKELYTIGYTKLFVFSGGIEEWTEAGLELERGPEEDLE